VDAVVQTAGSLLPSAGVSADQVAGVGVGCAGHINCDCGVVLTNSNLTAWDNHPLREMLQKRLGLPVVLDNDANCAAWVSIATVPGVVRGTCAMLHSAPDVAWASSSMVALPRGHWYRWGDRPYGG